MAEEKKARADAGKALRMMMLTTPAEKLKLSPDDEYPKVYGLVTDWNISNATASIVAMKDGTASVYTTTTFGIIGGQGNPTAREMARRCTKAAGQYYDLSTPVSEFPYPAPGTVNFYLLTYEGVRLYLGDEAAIKAGPDPARPLFIAAQNVLTALRMVVQARAKKEPPH